MCVLGLLLAPALVSSCGTATGGDSGNDPVRGSSSASGPASATSDSVAAAGIPYDLLIHCGVRYAIFDGANWVAGPPVPTIPTDATDPVSGGGSNHYVIHGTMRRLCPARASPGHP